MRIQSFPYFIRNTGYSLKDTYAVKENLKAVYPELLVSPDNSFFTLINFMANSRNWFLKS